VLPFFPTKALAVIDEAHPARCIPAGGHQLVWQASMSVSLRGARQLPKFKKEADRSFGGLQRVLHVLVGWTMAQWDGSRLDELDESPSCALRPPSRDELSFPSCQGGGPSPASGSTAKAHTTSGSMRAGYVASSRISSGRQVSALRTAAAISGPFRPRLP